VARERLIIRQGHNDTSKLVRGLSDGVDGLDRQQIDSIKGIEWWVGSCEKGTTRGGIKEVDGCVMLKAQYCERGAC
jgi:hypothetical protein